MAPLTVVSGAFATPRGRSVTLSYRPSTNDFNVLRSCLDEDEYRIKDLNLSGTALDVGAHIGGVTVALAVDNPDLRVVAIEPVPANLQLLRENVQRAGISDRVDILEAGAGPGPHTIRYGFTGTSSARVHRFIGNQHMPPGTPYREANVPGITLSELVERYGRIAFAKLDCEGCEHAFLDDPAVEYVDIVHGEFHDGPNAGLEFHPRGFRAVGR